MRANKILRVFIILGIIALLGWGAYELIRNLAFSFVTMLSVAMLMVLFLYFFHARSEAQTDDDNPRRRFSIMLVGCFGLLAMFAMSTYFYPSKEVFSNNDHHAIAVEGIETTRPSLLLASNSKDAFFDDHTMAGSIELTDISLDDSTAKLHIIGAGMPVYKIENINDNNYYVVLEGQDNIHSWEPGIPLEMINGGFEHVANLSIGYTEERKLLRSVWHADYVLDYIGSDGNHHVETSTFHGVIRQRYSLASLFPGVGTLQGVDFSKVELMRPVARIGKSNKDDEKLSQSPILVCYTDESGLGMLRSGDNTTRVGASSDIKVKLDGRSYGIGLFNSIPDFRLTVDTTGTLAVRYRMPMYRSLNTEGYRKNGKGDYYTFMIASTLVDANGEVNSQIPQNVLLYDVFDHNDNRFQMRPQFISFYRGNTLDSLNLSVFDISNGHNKEINVGERLPAIATSDSATHWIVSLDNFRDRSLQRPEGVAKPLSSTAILVFMLALTILCCISLRISRHDYHTFIEPIGYIILLSLLAIRLTLLWRASVFPPMNGISMAEFNAWRSGSGIFPQIVILSCALVLLVIFNKAFVFGKRFKPLIWLNPIIWLKKLNADYPVFVRANNKQNMHHLLWPQGKRAFWIVGGFAVYFIILLAGLATRKPMLCIGVPVIWYFIMDFAINLQVGSCWSDSQNHSYAFFWQGIINMVVATAVIFVLDGGYGLLFFVFSMLAMMLRLIDLYGNNDSNLRLTKLLFGNNHATNNEKPKQGVHLFGVILVSVFVVLIIVFLRRIAIGLFMGNLRFRIWVGIGTALFVWLLIWTVGGWRRFAIWNAIIVFLAFIIAVGAGQVMKLPEVADSHIANRILVLAKDPSEVLGQSSTPLNMSRFLEASLNDWVLENYDQRGNDVTSLVGEHGHGYFKMQPHSNVGVSWMTQLTDISVSRFLIAEQSNKVPIFLILVFFAMECAALFFPSDRRWSKSLLVQIPLLLTVQSLLVWMAVTRRFVFLGQDFPMISLISRVNLYMSIIGLLVWILTAIFENAYLRRYELKENQYRFLHVFGLYSAGALLVALLAIFVSHPKRHFKNNTYDVAECMKATNSLIADPTTYSIEALFREYQEQLIEENGSIADISLIGSPQQIFKDFCKSFEYDPDAQGNDDNVIAQLFQQDAAYGPFAKAAFDDFCKSKINQNDIDELIYIVKRRFVDPENNKVENVRYTLGITQRYFRQQLPKRIDKSWRGNLTASMASADLVAGKFNEGGLDVYTIPASWTKDKKPSIIVKPNTGQYSVVGIYEPRQLNRGEYCYLTEGEVLTGRNVPNLSKYGNGNYLAKNVFINSHPRFIYPLQADFYWSRPLAEQISFYMNHSMDTARSKAECEAISTSNSTVTLSLLMTKNLVQAIDGVTKEGNVAVVVADGDGRVRALVDHRKPCYVINPNDSRRIQFVEDSLKREGMLNRGHEAERFFGNKAILSLNFGPGSSQKPLVWTAVTTQYMGWDWNLLQMAKINNNLMHIGTKYEAWSFAGQRIDPRKRQLTGKERSMFRSIIKDEGAGNINVGLRSYMYKSSNYYNAIMVYLGSHTRAELDAGKPGNTNNLLLISRDKSWLTRGDRADYYCDSLFPLIEYGDKVYSFAKPLQAKDVMNDTTTLLGQGLQKNLGLPIAYDNNRSSYLHKSMENTENGIANYYAFPEKAYFNNKGRLGDKGLPFEVAREGIKSTAIGQKTVWIVSPLQMAEMFGKLISFNKNYRLTIDPEIPKLPYQPLETDESSKAYLTMRNQQFIPGLHEVFTGGEGTAHKVYEIIKNDLDRDYYIYGKTGTIDGKLKGRGEDDHLLAVVITNKDIATLNNVEDYQDLRFYVIYIANFDYGKQGEHYSSVISEATIIKTVLQSEEFKNYMKGN